MGKFLDYTGLTYFWSKIKALLANKANKDLSNATSNALSNIGGALVYTYAGTLSSFKRVYVSPTGNDNNTGADETHPMKSIVAAIKKYSNAHKYIDVFLLDGTYTENLNAIATDACNIGIRSASVDREAVTINLSNQIDSHINIFRIYNLTLNVTAKGMRALSVDGGSVFLYNVRVNVPSDSTSSCVNVYNGASLFAVNCIFNAPATGNGAAVYTNQGMLVRAVNCTSERTIACGVYAINGGTIEYTATMTATTMARTSNYGRCIEIQ